MYVQVRCKDLEVGRLGWPRMARRWAVGVSRGRTSDAGEQREPRLGSYPGRKTQRSVIADTAGPAGAGVGTDTDTAAAGQAEEGPWRPWGRMNDGADD